MQERAPKRESRHWVIVAILAGLVVCSALYWLGRILFLSGSFTKQTPEEILRSYVWPYDGGAISQATAIEGVARVYFGYHGPAFLKFTATEDLIASMLERDYGYNGMYSPSPCSVFYAAASQDPVMVSFPNRFGWWTPSEVVSPVCYRAQGHQSDDLRYLLIGADSTSVYFYRTATCGLCPD